MQRLHVAAARGIEECLRDILTLFIRHRKTRLCLLDMVAGSAGKLPASRRIAADGFGNLVEVLAENIVQQECGSFEWRKPLQRHHQGQCDVIIRLVFTRVEYRFRQPASHISFPSNARRLQMIKAEPRDGTHQEGFFIAHGRPVGLVPANEAFLNDIFRLRDRSEHAIGNADQPRSDAVERISRVVRQRHCLLSLDGQSGSR